MTDPYENIRRAVRKYDSAAASWGAARCDRERLLLEAECTPDTIRELLAERDALQRKLSLWEPIMAEIDRRAGKECCLEDRCDFTVTVEYAEYAAIAAANGGGNAEH